MELDTHPVIVKARVYHYRFLEEGLSSQWLSETFRAERDRTERHKQDEY
ncbi:MAG: hypothetical protein ACJ8MR_00360 [Povalibacter sp.]